MDTTTENHLRLLSIFHYVLAGFGALLSLLPVVHIVLGVSMLAGGFEGKDAPPPAFGWVFIALGAMVMLMGASYVVLVTLAGRFLSRRRHWTFCVVVAALSCALFPLGTALGVFTVIVLAKPEVKAAFEAGAVSGQAAPKPGPA